ncbi:MAG: hypothetical protein WBN88_11320 [Anderseniella sp.]
MIDVVLAVAAATWIAVAGMTGEVKAAAYDTSRLDRMPDFSQTDRRLNLPGGGSHYCVPVATANVLVWLAEQRGYKKLLPVQGLTTIEKVASVATELGSDNLMSTAPKGGTNLQKFVDGLSAFIRKSGYRPSLEAHSLWSYRNVSRNHKGAPDMYKIRSEFARGAGVWISVGFFKEGNRSGNFQRVGGHMTTMAGFGVNERGATDRDVIILHDPDDGHRASVQRRYLHPERIRNASLVDKNGRQIARLDDFLDVSSAFNMRQGYRAILMHVFVLDM